MARTVDETKKWHPQWDENPLLQFSLKNFFLRLFFLFSGPKIPQLCPICAPFVPLKGASYTYKVPVMVGF